MIINQITIKKLWQHCFIFVKTPLPVHIPPPELGREAGTNDQVEHSTSFRTSPYVFAFYAVNLTLLLINRVTSGPRLGGVETIQMFS